MLHFLKYCFLALLLFSILNLFRSNMATDVTVSFQLPLLWQWQSYPIALNYLLLVNFCAGILFSAFIGAFRVSDIRSKNRELKILRRLLKENKPSLISAEGDFPALDSSEETNS